MYPDPKTCWIWEGAKNGNGYGVFTLEYSKNNNIKRVLAHRYSWALKNGTIPDDLHVLHMCDTPLCVNPDHLFLGTNLDNIKDKIQKGRQIRGEAMGGAKLTDSLVRQIKNSPEKSSYRWAKELRLNIQTICNVRSGKSWGHIT